LGLVVVCDRMTIEINTQITDLSSFKIKIPEDEQRVTNELVSQILGWMKKNHKPFFRVNTLIMNKLVYFSMKEIQKINDSILITNGWYKYGPCYEELREREAPDRFSDYSNFAPRSNYMEEVERVCSSEFIKFEESSNTDASASGENRYYYNYLKHVYSEMVPEELRWLQPFYQSKHDLEHLMYVLAVDPNISDDKAELQQKFSDSLFKFESAICDTDYDSHVKLGKIQDVTLRFSALLEPIFNDYLLSTTQQVNPKIRLFAGEFARFFDDALLMPFAYKNLISTFESQFGTKDKKKHFDKAADNLTGTVNRRLPEFILTLKRFGLM